MLLSLEKPSIIPGYPDSSELMMRLLHHDPEIRMPYEKDALSPDEISKIRRWIGEGAEWQEHWSFIAPDKNIQPPSINDSWIRNEN